MNQEIALDYQFMTRVHQNVSIASVIIQQSTKASPVAAGQVGYSDNFPPLNSYSHKKPVSKTLNENSVNPSELLGNIQKRFQSIPGIMNSLNIFSDFVKNLNLLNLKHNASISCCPTFKLIMGIKSFAWNCQLVSTKISELTRYVQKNNIKLLKRTFKETWLTPRSNIRISNFSCYRADRSHGGVAILIHNSIPHSFLKHNSLEFAEAFFVKCMRWRWLHGGFYLLLSLCNESTINFFFSKPFPLLISGDFNAKHKEWNNSNKSYKGPLSVMQWEKFPYFLT